VIDAAQANAPLPATKGRGPSIADGPIESKWDAFVTGLDMTPEDAGKRIANLLSLANRPTKKRIYEASVQGQTDGSGNCLFKIWDVPAGYDAHLTRVIVEADGFTPGTTYSAGFWQLLEGEQGTTQPVAVGMLRTFATVIPSLQTDNDSNAWAYRSGSSVLFRLSGTAPIASKLVVVSFRANLELRD